MSLDGVCCHKRHVNCCEPVVWTPPLANKAICPRPIGKPAWDKLVITPPGWAAGLLARRRGRPFGRDSAWGQTGIPTSCEKVSWKWELLCAQFEYCTAMRARLYTTRARVSACLAFCHNWANPVILKWFTCTLASHLQKQNLPPSQHSFHVF